MAFVKFRGCLLQELLWENHLSQESHPAQFNSLNAQILLKKMVTLSKFQVYFHIALSCTYPDFSNWFLGSYLFPVNLPKFFPFYKDESSGRFKTVFTKQFFASLLSLRL
jgi:hypothetical protein